MQKLDEKRLSQKEAGNIQHPGVRQIKRLVKQYEEYGAAGWGGSQGIAGVVALDRLPKNGGQFRKRIVGRRCSYFPEANPSNSFCSAAALVRSTGFPLSHPLLPG